MARVQLSEHFYLDEFTRTSHTDLYRANAEEALKYEGVLRRLCLETLEKFREFWGPLTITSGFRGAALNRRVGSSFRSQHCKGEAADFTNECLEGRLERQRFLVWAADQYDCGLINWHQLLLEPGCIHVGLATGTRDGEMGYWEKKKTATGWKREKKIIRAGA